tara:strand:+ start:503 stop:643 length:141 start_codon:yes stop_codon:yes gene_type:complete
MGHIDLQKLKIILPPEGKDISSKGVKRADEEIRTLDILLGKEMLYH